MPFILLMVLVLMSLPLLHGAAVALITLGKVVAVLLSIALLFFAIFLGVKLIRSVRDLLREMGK